MKGPTDGIPTSEKTASTSKFRLASLTDPYDSVKPVREYVRSLVKAERLWDALVQATRASLSLTGVVDGRQTGVIVASHRLIGLAASVALIDDIKVPQRSRDQPLSADALRTALASDTKVDMFRSCVRPLQPEGSTLLMRAWEQKYVNLAMDFARSDREDGKADEYGIVCLLSAEGWVRSVEQADLPLLVDVSASGQPIEIVLGAIAKLGLPNASTEMKAPQLRQFVEDSGPSVILNWLNSEDHGDFNAKTWQYVMRHHRVASARRDLIVSAHENTPREAASLFVAAHFPSATPEMFFALADLLAVQTPSRDPGKNAPRDPAQVSDAVLRNCGIRFNASSQGALRPVISADNATADDATQHEAGEMSATIVNIFDKDAPLLRERYLQALAHWLTLGHASDKIAENYEDLELAALYSAAAAEPASAYERLRRVVFGYPVSMRADEEFLNSNERAFKRRLQRSILRVLSLIDAIALRHPDMTQTSTVAALCTTEPLDDDLRWTEDVHRAAAALFWQCYMNAADKVSFKGYPAFFGRASMTATGARVRRKAGMMALTEAMTGSSSDPALDQLSERMRNPQAISRVLVECARNFEEMVDKSGTEPFAANLLGEISSHYLLQALRGRLWNDVQLLPDVTVVAKALYQTDGLASWLNPPKRYQARETWDAACQDGKFQLAVETENDRLDREMSQTWTNAVLVLDGLLGLRSLDASDDNSMRNERQGHNIFFLSQLDRYEPQKGGPRDNPEGRYSFDNRAQWAWLCRPQEECQPWADEVTEADKPSAAGVLWYLVVRQLNGLYPVLLLIAGMRVRSCNDLNSPEFHVSSAMKDFLTTTPGLEAGSVLEDILISVDAGRKIQADFLSAMVRWRLHEPQLSQWRRLFRDREATLLALQRVLRPMLRDIRINGVTAGSSAVATSPSPSAAS